MAEPGKLRRLTSNRAVRFSFLFGASLPLFLFVVQWKPIASLLNETIAYLLCPALGLVGINASATGETVHSGGFAVVVSSHCNGAFILALFASAVVSYPTALRHKVIGLAAGTIALFLLNLMRAVALFLLILHSSDWFETVHQHLGPHILIFSVVVLWLLWARRTPGRSAQE